jgi:hypothetical protein
MKPTIVHENDKFTVKYDIGLDLNNDGQKSVVAGFYIEATEKEVMEEVIAKVLANTNLPDWAKALIGAK